MLAAAILATTVACGSQPDEDAPTTSPSAETPTTATAPADPAAPSLPPPAVTTIPGTREHGALAECLNEHGVEEPSSPETGPAPGPAPAPPGVDQDTWEDAMQACSSLGPGPAGG